MLAMLDLERIRVGIVLCRLDNNNFLSAKDLAGLQFRTQLVVLSGCETGLSQLHKGDELIGLPRVFLLAGVKSLLVSQWKVDDKSTQMLFEYFYRNWVQSHQISIVTAFRNAVLQLKDLYRDPYYWAPFILVGNWRLQYGSDYWK